MEILPVLDKKVLKIAGTSQEEMPITDEEGNRAGIDPVVSPHLINGRLGEVKEIQCLAIVVEDVEEGSLYCNGADVPVGIVCCFVGDLRSLECV